jgi:hypothetical protein
MTSQNPKDFKQDYVQRACNDNYQKRGEGGTCRVAHEYKKIYPNLHFPVTCRPR